ncbi:MAG: hypothetical protein KAI57_01140 [Candidatus Pacebacteria bacterium]|nr:hypothetical protein [Candidatus Paceibacterota bacterium]
MEKIKPSLIGKSLENERDTFCLNLDNILFNDILKEQLNIFFSIYILSISDQNDSLEDSDGLELYRFFYNTKFNGVRFLLELFLTSLEIVSKASDQEKNNLCFSLAVSEKINIHSMNKDILAFDPSNINCINAVKNGRKNYIDFLKKYSKISQLVPDDIENFFSTNNLNLLSSRKEKDFKSNFGFKYYRYSKVNYGNVIKGNERFQTLIEKIKKIGIFPSVITTDFIKNVYTGISTETHPTISTIEHFNTFISKSKKEKIHMVFNAKENYDAFLKVIGVLMDILYKELGNKEIKDLKYSD